MKINCLFCSQANYYAFFTWVGLRVRMGWRTSERRMEENVKFIANRAECSRRNVKMHSVQENLSRVWVFHLLNWATAGVSCGSRAEIDMSFYFTWNRFDNGALLGTPSALIRLSKPFPFQIVAFHSFRHHFRSIVDSIHLRQSPNAFRTQSIHPLPNLETNFRIRIATGNIPMSWDGNISRRPVD